MTQHRTENWFFCHGAARETVLLATPTVNTWVGGKESTIRRTHVDFIVCADYYRDGRHGLLHAGGGASPDKGVQATLDAAPAAVHKAAADALAVIGCEIKKDEPNLVEGVRTRKVGVFVGSGGETVTVSIDMMPAGKTNVDIRTKKTFVGGAGQKNWDQPVLDEIRKSLAATAASSPATASK